MMASSTETGIMFGRVHCLREFKCHGANQEFVWPRRFGERKGRRRRIKSRVGGRSKDMKRRSNGTGRTPMKSRRRQFDGIIFFRRQKPAKIALKEPPLHRVESSNHREHRKNPVMENKTRPVKLSF
ncbi:hypothetical protein Bca4012_048762 [Brassica carinata]